MPGVSYLSGVDNKNTVLSLFATNKHSHGKLAKIIKRRRDHTMESGVRVQSRDNKLDWNENCSKMSDSDVNSTENGTEWIGQLKDTTVVSDHSKDVSGEVVSDHSKDVNGEVVGDHSKDVNGEVVSDYSKDVTGEVVSDHSKDVNGEVVSDYSKDVSGDSDGSSLFFSDSDFEDIDGPSEIGQSFFPVTEAVNATLDGDTELVKGNVRPRANGEDATLERDDVDGSSEIRQSFFPVTEAVNATLDGDTELGKDDVRSQHANGEDATLGREAVDAFDSQFVCMSQQDDGHAIVDFLMKTDNEAEARLAARRQARAEAREIRMRELERLQKEQEENADRAYDMYTGIAADPVSRASRVTAAVGSTGGSRVLANSLSSRRSSEDSLEDGLSLRDVRHELRDVEDRFRKAMIANAQLDNDKAASGYQLQLLKDRLEDLEEAHAQLQREHKDKCREHEQLKRAAARLSEDLNICRAQLNERDELIAEAGLVIVGGEMSGIENGDGDAGISKRTLVSAEGAQLLEDAGEGSLDVRLRSFAEERKALQSDVQRLQRELSETRSQGRRGASNGPIGDADDLEDVQREANKQLGEARFRLQKAEQEASSLQAVVARLESQVVRYKSAAEASEKAEEALKIDKRKLQRESREALARVEELETANNHLHKRLDKLKNAKSALLKEL